LLCLALALRDFGIGGMYVDWPSCFTSHLFSVFVVDSVFNCCFGRVEFPLGVCLWLGWLSIRATSSMSLRGLCVC
jgi:hypothetical protein